ncbi:MAG TPA: minor capsid protein [Massilibacterium sp.]|nr:minor capsid protein [Massilibacterium sp.]
MSEPKELDFIWRLNDYINTLDLFAWSVVGVLGDGDSVSLMAMPGGEETVFHDGTRDKNYQMQVNAKSLNQLNCIESLSQVARVLENLQEGEIQSQNDTFDFESIKITSPLSIVAQDEQGFFIYALSISAKITIYERVED